MLETIQQLSPEGKIVLVAVVMAAMTAMHWGTCKIGEWINGKCRK